MSTVGLNGQMVAKYIREQEQHDIAMDKLGIKEYKNPFKKTALFISKTHYKE